MAAGCRRRVFVHPTRQPRQPGMDGKADSDIDDGKDQIDLAPAQVFVQCRRQRPEQGGGEAGDQRQMGDAALRPGAADLDDRDESGAVEHEGGRQLHRHQRRHEAHPAGGYRASDKRCRGRSRAKGHHPAGAETIGPAPGCGCKQATDQQRRRQGAENPLFRPGELKRDRRHQDAKTVIERAVADDLRQPQRPECGSRDFPVVH